MVVNADKKSGIPLAVETFCQAPDDIKRFRVVVHQCQCGAVKFFGAHQSGEGILAERGAARTDHDNFGWKTHKVLLLFFQSSYSNLIPILAQGFLSRTQGDSQPELTGVQGG